MIHTDAMARKEGINDFVTRMLETLVGREGVTKYDNFTIILTDIFLHSCSSALKRLPQSGQLLGQQVEGQPQGVRRMQRLNRHLRLKSVVHDNILSSIFCFCICV
jgi:hypothetical protein